MWYQGGVSLETFSLLMLGGCRISILSYMAASAHDLI
jgi:hypothetical protein